MLKNKPENNDISWQPSADLPNLRIRTKVIQLIRNFFEQRDVLEVETPLISHTSVTDPFIQSIPCSIEKQGKLTTFYLQTSPEYAMKRLLAAGSGAIFQICKAFRQGEIGRHHNPEFSMLEWYRPNFNHHNLMDEMDELLQLVLNCAPAQCKSYQDLFLEYLQINPHCATLSELANCASRFNLSIATELQDKDSWLDVLMSHLIEPNLGQSEPCFIYDYPASQAALARILPGDPAVAARFEVYAKGMELANGFYELSDASEQRRRFENNRKERAALGLTDIEIDENLLAALAHGLPDCAGVALGIDRLVMLAAKAEMISDVISFDIGRA